MSYATTAQLNRFLHDVYGQLYYVAPETDAEMTDQQLADAEAAAQAEAAQLAEDDLDAASAEIDGALGCRYLVPVARAEVLPMLRTWCLALAAELAWGRSAQAEPPKNLVERCKHIRARLAEYEAGNRILAADQARDTGGRAAVAAIVQADTPLMTRAKLGGW